MLVALRITFLTLVTTGLLYPLAGVGIGRVLFPGASTGSLVRDGSGGVIGSALIGQRFTRPAYFHGRPSAAGEQGYDATRSGGSNLGPTSRALKDRADAERSRLLAENAAAGPVPVDLVSASASGLDPHVSPEAARWQAPRVARARGVDVGRVQSLVDSSIEPRTLGVLGEPRVNVLLLNLALDAQFGSP